MKGNRSDLEMPLNQKYDRLNNLPDIWTGKDVQLDSDETHRWNNLRYNELLSLYQVRVNVEDKEEDDLTIMNTL